METKKRETSTTFEFDGRTFKINAFDPMTGNYILAQIIQFVLPMGIGNMLNEQVKGTEQKQQIGVSGQMMSKKDFIQLQIDILSTVSEVKASGHEAPVVRENGTYGVEDVTSLMCIKLIVASLAFNFKDFFSEVPSLEKFISR